MNKLINSKKGQMGVMDGLAKLAIGAGTLGLILVIVFLVLGKLGTQAVADASASNYSACTSYACNTTKIVQDETSQIAPWIGIVIITVIGFMMIAIFKGRK